MILRPLIAQVCAQLGLTPDILEAIATVESGGSPWAYNPEPRYRYLWDVHAQAPFRALTDAERASEEPPVDFPCLAGDRDQEWWAQQASWGLLQLMGAVAREHGFLGPYLPELCDPLTNLTLGARVVRSLVLWADGDLTKAAAAYNAGRGGWRSEAGQQYAAKVLREMRAIAAARLITS